MNKIKEAIKTNYGKLIYVVQLEQDDNNKLQLYIDNSNKVYFDTNEYNFAGYKTFDLSVESNRIAKEIFLTQLQAEVKRRILELKQLEYLESYNTDFKNCRFGEAPISIRELGDLLDILQGSDKE